MASSSVMEKLPTFSLKDKTPNPIQEVRFGLYLIQFTPDDIAIGRYTFYLRNNDYLPYTLVFQPCPEANQGTPLLVSLIKTQSTKLKNLPVASDDLDLAEANTQQDINQPHDDQPRFVWIVPNGQHQENNKITHLILHDSSEDLMMSQVKRIWGPALCPRDNRFNLWIDFGTETPGEKKVLNQWASQLTKQENTDVEFNVQGELMGAHSPIIMSGSSVFASMIQQQQTSEASSQQSEASKTTVSDPTIIQIIDVEPQVFEQLLHYLYTGRIPLLEEDGMANRLFNAAGKYGLDNLKEECERFMLADLNEHNAIQTLIWSSANSLSYLFDRALNLVSINYPQVMSQPDWQNLMDEQPQIDLRVNQLMANLPGNK